MSLDLRPSPPSNASALAARGSGGGGGRRSPEPQAAAAKQSSSGASEQAGSTAGAGAGTGQSSDSRRRRQERVAAAAARMADATRQVGSLLYMAPELVTSTTYNEKVDVFSFAIIAWELFSGKLLAMKVATQLMGEGGDAGPPVLGGAAGEAAAGEAGVMRYVLRRSEQGVREPMPSWWPPPLKDLITRCWAQDPAARPPFEEVFRALTAMLHSGALNDMDARDPLRQPACGCSIM